jgi:multisubunit Na+/H+ antiporter MnhE subunit
MLRRVGGWLAVWAASMAAWLLFVLTLAPAELVAGAVAAGISSLAVAVVHRFDPVRLAFGPAVRWLAGSWRLPWQIVVETLRLAAALWRQVARGQPVSGRFRTIPFPVGEPEPVAATRRTIATTIASLAPNTYVVGIEDGYALIHQLLPDDADPIPPSLLAPATEDRGRAP